MQMERHTRNCGFVLCFSLHISEVMCFVLFAWLISPSIITFRFMCRMSNTYSVCLCVCVWGASAELPFCLELSPNPFPMLPKGAAFASLHLGTDESRTSGALYLLLELMSETKMPSILHRKSLCVHQRYWFSFKGRALIT